MERIKCAFINKSSPEGKSMVAMMAHVRAGAETGLDREGVGEKEWLIPGE